MAKNNEDKYDNVLERSALVSVPQTPAPPNTPENEENSDAVELEANKRTNEQSSELQMERSIVEEVSKPAKRKKKRGSYDIYEDQDLNMFEIQLLYKKKTGNKLSSSRIVRQALDDLIPKLLKELR